MRQFPASDATAAPTAIGLSPEGFDRVFPFHLACDAGLIVTQIGRSLRRMAADARPGMLLREAFRLTRPDAELSVERLDQLDGSLVIVQHRASGILLRGQFLRTSGIAGWVFIGSPWFVSGAALEASGLSLEDFAPHDSIAELLLLGQTQQMAINDLNLLNERLERKRRQVEDTEALYRAAISAANAVAYREEFDRDEFTYLGDGFQALTGFGAGQLKPSGLRALEDPGSDDARLEETVLRSGQHLWRRRREYPIRTRDGELRWVSDASVVIRNAEGKPIGAIGALYDISARRAADEQLRRSEEQARRLAIVTSRTSSAVVITNAERQIEWVNDAFTSMSGFTMDDVRGRLMREVLRIAETDPEMSARSLHAMAAREAFRGEIRLQRKDGSIFWVSAEVQPLLDPDGALSGYTAVAADITAAKEYEHRLEQLGDELNAILSVIPGGIVALDDRGRFAYCNAAFEALVGRKGSELEGLDADALDGLLAGLCDSQDRPVGFLNISDSESDVLRFAAPARTITRTARLIKGDSAAAQWRAFYLRDVTREAELDRMKSEFLSTAAHELRTPMSSVHGFAELLISRDFDADTVRTIARTIHRQSSLLVQMVNELLDLARIEAGRGRDFVMEAQPLAPIVKETAMSMLVSGDPRRVELVPSAGDPLRVTVDGPKLRLAITNVIGNAYKYSRGRGAIRVSLPTRRQIDRQEVGIRVQDEGIGMTPEQLSHVFDRFYRADPAGDLPGTGLGMTLVKEIVESMQGSVEITSQPGHGTTVTLWLPVATA